MLTDANCGYTYLTELLPIASGDNGDVFGPHNPLYIVMILCENVAQTWLLENDNIPTYHECISLVITTLAMLLPELTNDMFHK